MRTANFPFLLLLALAACGEKDVVDDSGVVDDDGDGYSAAEDCDDGDAAVNPGATELCDGVDNDCDGDIDGGASDPLTFYADADGDGFGAPDQPVEACEAPEGAVAEGSDCDDGDDAVFPGAEEVCNGVDDDCDGDVDGGAIDAPTWYSDADGDGYGDPETGEAACSAPSGAVADDSDCDDSDGAVSPEADELCDGVDNNCDGEVDEDSAVDAPTWYADADNDGYGDPSAATAACEAPAMYVGDDSDCDDAYPQVNPGASERCDDLDNDCDGDVDWGWRVPSDYADIQTAIDAASSGQTVCVEAGTYAENIDFSGRDITVQGTEGAEATIIDGGGSGPVVTFENEEGEDSVLVGFTVTGGEALLGAGVYVSGASPTLVDLVITDNSATDTESTCRGVGLYVYAGDPTLMQVEVSDNVSDCSYVYGSGAYFDESLASIEGLRVTGNAASAVSQVYAPLAFRNESLVDVSNLVVLNNSAEAGTLVAGGGVYIYAGSDLVMDNAIIAGNTSTASTVYGGGVMVFNYSSPTLSNVVVHGNTVDASDDNIGQGLLSYNASPTLVNAVITDNTTIGAGDNTYAGGVSLYAAGTATLSYSDVYNNDEADYYGMTDPTGNDGNVSVDPLFVESSDPDPTQWDFTLDPSSPVIDAGDPGLSDPDGSTSDMGAYGGAGAATWGWAPALEELRRGEVSEGYVVELPGLVVTGVYPYGFTAQDPAATSAAYSGVTVYTGGPPEVQRGWEVTVLGEYSDYYGESQVAADEVWVSAYAGEPAATELTVAEALDEAYESVLVTITDGSLDDAAYDCSADGSCSDSDLWTLTDGSSTPIIAYDKLYEGEDWTDYIGALPVTGVMGYRWNRRRVLPRDSADFE